LKFLNPPQYDDVKQNQTARQLHYILWTIILASTMVIPILVFVVPDAAIRWWVMAGGIDVVCLVLLALSFRGYTYLSSKLLVLFSIIVVTEIAFTSNGIRSPSIYAFIVIVLIAGLLLGTKGGINTALVSCLIGLGLIYIETKGGLPAARFVHTDYSLWMSLAFYLAIAVGLQHLFSTSLRRSLQKALQELNRRSLTEMALSESMERYKNQFEKSHAVMLVIDPDSARIIDANPAACAFYGWSLEEILKKKIDEINILTPEEVYAEMQLAVSEKRNHFFFKHRLADGSLRDVEVYDGPLIQKGKTLLFSIIHDITNRVSAEEALQENNDLLMQFVSHSPIYCYIKDVNPSRSLVLQASDNFQQMIGIPAKEMIGRTMEELYPPEFAAKISADDLAVVSKGDVLKLGEELNGRSYETIKFPIIQGGKTLLAGYTIDVTDRKHAEETLRESEIRFRTFIEQSPLAILISRKGYMLYTNEKFLRTYGIKTADEAIGKPVTELYAPQTLKEGKERSRRRSLGLHTENDFETIGLRRDGSQFPCHVIVETVNLPDGPADMVFISDISERKKAEEQVWKSEKKYRELFQVNKDGIAIFLINPLGPPGKFVEVNDAAPKMLGYTKDEMLQLTPMMLEPQATQELVQKRELEFSSKGVINFETILRHKNGKPVYTEFTSQVIEYEGKPAIMNIVRDITERKQSEKEMRVIGSLSAALRTAPTLREMLPVIVEQTCILLDSDSISVELIEPDTKDAIVEAAYGEWVSMTGSRQPEGSGLNAWIAETRLPFLHNNIKEDPRVGFPEYMFENILAAAGVPLIAQDKLIGFLWMGRKKEIADSEVRLLVAVADIAANAIHRATLHEQTQKDAANLNQAYDTTLEGWAHALELRDHETEGHSRKVVQMTVALARYVGINEDGLENIKRGALLHDIGKMGIPDSVLLKPGTLNEREWEIMRRHPEYGYDLIRQIEYLRPVVNIPYCHHEKWDGSGYPRGLKAEEIPFEARIFAIVDVWDALISDRPYRKAWSYEQAYKHIEEQAGKHFDPQIVKAFLEMLDSQRKPTENQTPSEND
jgi:PAS domain S-box-containing protein